MSASNPNAGHTRREILTSGAAFAVVAALGTPGAAYAAPEPLTTLEIWGPPAGPSITVLHAIASGYLDGVARKPSVRIWRQVDEIRAGLTSKTLDMGILPITVAANLYNRGLGVRLVNVMTNGLLYIMAADPAIRSLDALRGKKFGALFPNELPALLINRLFKHHGLTAGQDFEPVPASSPLEAMQLLIQGRVDVIVVPEPAASGAILQGTLAGKTIHRVLDLQVEWGKMTGRGTIVPQAGLVVTDAFLQAHGDKVTALQAALMQAVGEVRATPSRAANNVAGGLGMPWPMIEKSIPFCNLVTTPARDARADIEPVLSIVAEADIGIIGGKLPDAAFYF